jgi:hypothetical protein
MVINMGGGNWAASNYANNTQAKIASGTSFHYDRKVRATKNYIAHEDLDPKTVAGPASPYAGQIMRESRDNDEHPDALPIVVGLDQTGSMGQIPIIVQTKLGGLFGLIQRKGYATDPQILLGAYGDTHSDKLPLQVSQFESDNRIDENLDNLFLEGNGGGNGGESLSLLWYYVINHTVTDAWEKRGKKGYAFFIADEITHQLTPQDITRHIGEQPIGNIDNVSLAKALLEKWDAYMLVIRNSSSHMQGSEAFYKNLFGAERVLMVEDPAAITETIALTIGVMEGTAIFANAQQDMTDAGLDLEAVKSATRSVAALANSVALRATGTADLTLTGDSKVGRI